MKTVFPTKLKGIALRKKLGGSPADPMALWWFVVVATIAGLVAKAGAMEEKEIVFVVENSADHIYQLEQAIRKAALTSQLKIARYGNEAVLYLKGVGIYGDRNTYPLPRVVVLDLDLPDGSALAVLGWIRQQPELTGVPVLAVGYPGQAALVDDALKLGATGWFAKSDIPGLIETIRSLLRPEDRGVLA
jgi:CheY-like chemotaxis protein